MTIPFDMAQAIIQAQQQQPRRPSLFDRIAEGRQRLEEPQDPRRQPGLFEHIGNRLAGLPPGGLLSDEEERFARSQALLSFGASMLASGGSSRDPISFGQALSTAIPAGQQAASRGLQQQDFLTQRRAAQQSAEARAQALQQAGQLLEGDNPDYPGAIRTMLQAGLTDEALKLSQAAENLRGDPIKTVTDGAGNVFALDSQTGDILNRIGMKFGDETVQLTPEQFRQVDTIRDDLVKETGLLLDKANSFTNIMASANDFKAAIQSNDRRAATAASTAIVNAFARFLDPGSIVRDPEFLRILKLGDVGDRATAFMNKFLEGTMSVDVLNSIVRNAKIQVEETRKQYQDVYVASARGRLKSVGIADRHLNEPDPFRDFEQALSVDIPEPFVPPRTFKSSFGERLVEPFRPERSRLEELVDLVTQSARERFEQLSRDRRGNDALTPFENR